LLRKLLILTRAALQITEAQEAASLGDFGKAKQFAINAYKIIGVTPPSRKVPVDLNLTLSQICIELNESDLALYCAETALAQLEAGETRLRGNDRAYITAFARAMVHYSRIWNREDTSEVEQLLAAFPDVKVSKTLKLRYPLPPEGRFLR